MWDRHQLTVGVLGHALMNVMCFRKKVNDPDPLLLRPMDVELQVCSTHHCSHIVGSWSKFLCEAHGADYGSCKSNIFYTHCWEYMKPGGIMAADHCYSQRGFDTLWLTLITFILVVLVFVLLELTEHYLEVFLWGSLCNLIRVCNIFFLISGLQIHVTLFASVVDTSQQTSQEREKDASGRCSRENPG